MSCAFCTATKQLVNVKKELGHFAHWKNLGLNLELHCSKLEVIERDYRSTNEQLEAVLTEWLKMNYDIEVYELLLLRHLANAAESIDCALAIAIKEHDP